MEKTESLFACLLTRPIEISADKQFGHTRMMRVFHPDW